MVSTQKEVDRREPTMLICISVVYLDTHHTEMVGHTVSLFMEGFETSSTVLSFALYELARTPEWQDRLHQEVIDVLEKHNNNFTYEALQDMVLVDCAVQGNFIIFINYSGQTHWNSSFFL